MLLPYTVEVPMARVPLANWALIAITSVVSLAILFGLWRSPEPRSHELIEVWDQYSNRRMSPQDLDRAIEAAGRGREYDLPPLALRRGDFSFLQLFSHLFVHGDLLHLAGNMIFLFVFGNAVNAKLGHALFLASYFLLGAIAGAAWLLLSGGPALVGASGAIMGLVGVFLVFFPRNDVRVYYMFTLAWTGAFSISSCWLILFYLACDIVGTVYGHGGIAYIAHVVGGLGGMALAIGLLAGGWLESDPGEENLLQVLGMQEKEKTYNERVSQAKKALKKKKRG